MNPIYLNRFGVENFRKVQGMRYINLRPLTLLTGTNNSGKSSFIRALRLLFEVKKTSEFSLNQTPYMLNSDEGVFMTGMIEVILPGLKCI